MNDSTAAARVVVAALLDLGVRHVVLCPGSRSAPLAYALHDAERAGDLTLHVRHDERTAGFVALGIGRVAGKGPAAVVTTSGTAVANLHPAVLEAQHGDVPLLVLSADRPAQLRGTWANQTTELQAGLFGGAVRFAADLPVATDAELLRRWAAAVRDAVRAARGGLAPHLGRPGPAHLDLAFADPLVPDGAESRWETTSDEVRTAVVAAMDVDGPSAQAAPLLLDDGPRTVVVAGDGAGVRARALAEAGGWPLLAEPGSHARSGPNAVGPYRLLLDAPHLGGRVERVVAFGRPTLSRQVTRLLARPDVELVLVETSPGRPDPGRAATRVAVPPVPRSNGGPASGWLAAWRDAATAAARAVDRVLDARAAAGELTGPLVAREVAAALGPAGRLVVASSNVVRDLDLAAAPLLAPPLSGPDAGYDRVLANRGLSGIDGTLSTAVGVAAATARPTRALVGDLAFLHDLGALAVPASERDRLDLQVVVLNDDGGGIFGLLEHGEPARAASFERVFGTPHGADLAALCAGFGVRHARATTLAALRAALRAPGSGLSVLEVRADRSALRVLHADIRAAVGSEVLSRTRPTPNFDR